MRTRELEFMRRRRSGGIISNARASDLDISDQGLMKMIGVEDFGAKMVNYSIGKILFDVTFAVVATKNETLLKSAAPQRVLCSSPGILVCVFGYPERIRELNGAVMMLQEVAHPTAEIDWSVVVDISSDFVETIIIATNIELKGKQHNGKL